MSLVFNLLLACFATLGTLVAFGGETWRRGPEPLFARITVRGRASLVLLLLGFVFGVAKEVWSAKKERDSAVVAEGKQKFLSDELTAARTSISDQNGLLNHQSETLKSQSDLLEEENKQIASSANDLKLFRDTATDQLNSAERSIRSQSRLLDHQSSTLAAQSDLLNGQRAELAAASEEIRQFRAASNKDASAQLVNALREQGRVDRIEWQVPVRKAPSSDPIAAELILPSLPRAVAEMLQIEVSFSIARREAGGHETFRGGDRFEPNQMAFDYGGGSLTGISSQLRRKPYLWASRQHWSILWSPDVFQPQAAEMYEQLVGDRPILGLQFSLKPNFKSEEEAATFIRSTSRHILYDHRPVASLGGGWSVQLAVTEDILKAVEQDLRNGFRSHFHATASRQDKRSTEIEADVDNVVCQTTKLSKEKWIESVTCHFTPTGRPIVRF